MLRRKSSIILVSYLQLKPFQILKMMKTKFVLLVLNISLLFNISGICQTVKVNVNSGNPKFPFPQFLAYEASGGHKLGNLATNNPVGVTHAEMEKTIRDAWQIFANEFEYTGEVYLGVKYIKGNIGCPYDCSEGDGYALLAAAYMADKTTFDGLWFRIHDKKRVKKKKYSNCTDINPNYNYGNNTLLDDGNYDAATDGSEDIAMALLMAWKQWGDNSGYIDACGKAISYKTEALEVIRGLVEKYTNTSNPNSCNLLTGIVGLDGYLKNGNTWGETTTWAKTFPQCPEFYGSQSLFADYTAPSYYNSFAEFLQKFGGTNEDLNWNISQFKRAEASSDWLVKKHFDSSPSAIFSVGKFTINDTTVKSLAFMGSADFRYGWRTALNYVWNGNPTTTWDPVSHQLKQGANTFELDMAKRHSKFLSNPSQSPWLNTCSSLSYPSLTYSGPSQLVTEFNTIGKQQSPFVVNWYMASGTPSSVASQDYELMAKLYRQCAITWESKIAGDGYLTSVPQYFHGWFRLLGMLITTGNYHSPMQLVEEANLKVYQSVNKTIANVGDTINYKVDYRNYSSVTANNVIATTQLPEGLEFISASNSGIISGNIITWNIGNVAGFQSSIGVMPTQGNLNFKVKIKSNFSGKICNSVEIKSSNGKGWISNEYPNNETSVMERNCVDVIKNEINIIKTINYTDVNDKSEIKFAIKLENHISENLLIGGRKGVVLSYARNAADVNSIFNIFKFRLFHGADEPYIDYGNYRFSYFINDDKISGYNSSGGAKSWSLQSDIIEGTSPSTTVITSEKLTPGKDDRGSWNQKLTIKFSNQIATITPHLSRFYDNNYLSNIHLGTGLPLRNVWRLFANTYENVNWSDDWSWSANTVDTDQGLYYPITNDFSDFQNPNIPVKNWHNEACQKPTTFVDNVLVEEWDGFVWRKVAGNAPFMGKIYENVEVTDTLDEGLEFKSFTKQNLLGVNASTILLPNGKTVIKWSISKFALKSVDSLSYTAKVKTSCTTNSKAWFFAKDLSTIPSKNINNVSCTITDIENPNQINSILKVFPNPANNIVNFQLAENITQLKLTIFDVLGNKIKEVSNTEFANGLFVLNTNNLNTGLYTYQVVINNSVIKLDKVLIIK